MLADLTTGNGVDAALDNVQVVMHLAGTAKGDEAKALGLVKAAQRTGVRHLVYISVVGADRMPVKSTSTARCSATSPQSGQPSR